MSITILLQMVSFCLPMGFIHRRLTIPRAHVAQGGHITMGDSSAGSVASKSQDCSVESGWSLDPD